MQPVLLDSSFLIDFERELELGIMGPARTWLRAQDRRSGRVLLVSSVTIAEVMEGAPDGETTQRLLSNFTAQPLGHQHALKCAEIQRKAAARGRRHGENDAWQLAVAECAKASIVARDTLAFECLGKRYEQY